MTSKIGFADEEIIWLHSYFTDVKIAPSTISLAEIETILPDNPERKEVAGRLIRYHYPQDDICLLYTSFGGAIGSLAFSSAMMGGNLRSMSLFSVGLSPWMSAMILWQMFSFSKKMGLRCV